MKRPKHHYTPRFYLAEWAGPDGKVWCYQRNRSGEVVPRRVGPSETGYVRGLYALKRTSLQGAALNPHRIEAEILGRIDTEGAKVLRKLKEDRPHLNDEEKEWWALFVTSLIERNHATVRSREAAVYETANELTAKMLAECDTKEKRLWLGRVLADFNPDAAAENLVREFMVQEIGDPEVRKYLTECTWTIHEAGETPFVTSDTPVLINAGAGPAPYWLLSCPLGPDKLFVVHSPTSEFDDEFYKTLVRRHNLLMLKRGCRQVYSRDLVTNEGPIRTLQSDKRAPAGRPRKTP